jgi:FkbM family methyltransferase
MARPRLDRKALRFYARVFFCFIPQNIRYFLSLRRLFWFLGQFEEPLKLLLLYFFITKGERRTIRMKDGTAISVRPRTTDTITLFEVIMRDNYRLRETDIDNGVILDIGAHIGTFSMYASKFGKDVKIFSFEPEPLSFGLLSSNISANKLSDRVSVFNLAVSDKDGPGELFVDRNSTGEHSIIGTDGKRISVELVSLDKVFKNNNIKGCRLMKMDVEGAEYKILYNTKPDILRRIDNIYMEYHNLKDIPENNGTSLKRFLESVGFSVEISKPDLMNNGHIYARRKQTVQKK